MVSFVYIGLILTNPESEIDFMKEKGLNDRDFSEVDEIHPLFELL